MAHSTDVSIRPLSSDDLDAALALSSGAGWNQRLEDWRMLVALAPDNGHVAVHDGRVVGTALGLDYGEFSWVAMMLVEPAFRGQGIGRRLLGAVLDGVPAHTPVRLDATPMGRPLYERHGFQIEAVLIRLTRAATSGGPPAGTADAVLRARPLSQADLAAVAERDRHVFRGDRRRLLAWAFEQAPAYARVIDAGGAPAHYCFGRRGRLFDQVGPIVAADERHGRALADAALRQDRALAVDIFEQARGVARWLHACGFTAQRPLFRMRRPAQRTGGPARPLQSTELTELAIFGPEFA